MFENAEGVKKIRFDASEANRFSKSPLGLGRGSVDTAASLGPDGKVLVSEGKHRLEAIRRGANIPESFGGIPSLPGWLEYDVFPQ